MRTFIDEFQKLKKMREKLRGLFPIENNVSLGVLPININRLIADAQGYKT